jgi:hypothetical protein
MGSPSASGPNEGPAGKKTDGTYGTKKDAEQTRLENFQKSTINKTKDSIKKSPFVPVKLLSPLAVSATDVTSKFFTDKVLTSSKAKKNIGYTQSEFAALDVDQQNEIFSKYSSGRQSGQLDAYGNLMPGYRKENIAHKKADGTMTTREVIMSNDGGNDGNNTIGQVTKTAPTTAEVSQATTAEAAGATAAETAKTTEANRLLKIKKKGRSQSIMTGSKGVTKTSTDYSLGKKSLLGRV